MQPLPNVADYGTTSDWNINAINAPEAWAKGYRGQGVIVAVIDSGVDRNHYELKNKIWKNADELAGDGIDNDDNGFVDDVYGWNFADNNSNTTDNYEHGTHIAGTIAAARDGKGTTGVAYQVKIMPLRVLNRYGSGSSSAVAKAVRYAVDNGADIVNLSLGGANNAELRDALAYAAQHGVLVIAASGNAGSMHPGFPAVHSRDLDNVLSVGAYSSNGRLAKFSNKVGSTGTVQVDAPGVEIYSTVPFNGYDTLNGTSMASPHVTGIAALALSANPHLTPKVLRQLIIDGAQNKIGNSDSIGGIDAARTVAGALATVASSQDVATAIASANSTSQSTTLAQALSTRFAQDISERVPANAVGVVTNHLVSNGLQPTSLSQDGSAHDVAIGQLANGSIMNDQIALRLTTDSTEKSSLMVDLIDDRDMDITAQVDDIFQNWDLMSGALYDLI